MEREVWKIGDRVKITEGKCAGMLGRIYNINHVGNGYTVKIQLDNTAILTVDCKSIIKADKALPYLGSKHWMQTMEAFFGMPSEHKTDDEFVIDFIKRCQFPQPPAVRCTATLPSQGCVDVAKRRANKLRSPVRLYCRGRSLVKHLRCGGGIPLIFFERCQCLILNKT